MSTPAMPFDASYVPDEFDRPPRRCPGGLTAICVIAIVLGGLSVLTSLASLGGAAFQGTLQKTFTIQQKPGMSADLSRTLKAQAEAQAAMQAVAHKYLWFTIGSALLNIAVGACLLTGGIRALQMRPKADSFLIAVFIAGIVFEIAACVVTVLMQIDLAPAMSQLMMAATPKSGPAAEQAAVGAIIGKVAMVFGIALNLGWALGKMIFYGVGARYLRRPNIQPLFQSPANEPI
jgi:hypothetical protein